MNPEERQKVIDYLSRKGVDSPCQRCGNIHFEILGIGCISLDLLSSVVDAGARTQVAILACSHCGFIIQHALGALYADTQKEVANV